MWLNSWTLSAGTCFSSTNPVAVSPFLGASRSHSPDSWNPRFVPAKSERLHTVVDTCGFAPSSVLLRLLPYVDQFLFDLKLAGDSRHLRAVGVSNASILANLALLASNHREVVVRVPVIPGVNDDSENLQQSFDILSNLGLRRVDLLPFHQSGWRNIGGWRSPTAWAAFSPHPRTGCKRLRLIFRAADFK